MQSTMKMLIILGLLLCYVYPGSALSRREVTVDAFCSNLTAIETDLTNKFQTDSPDETILSEFSCSCSEETVPTLALNCSILFTPAEDASVQVELMQEATFILKSNNTDVYMLETVTTCTRFGQQEPGCFTYEISSNDCDDTGGNHWCAASCHANLCESCEICNATTNVALQDCNGTLASLNFTTCDNAADPVLLWDTGSFPIILLSNDNNNNMTTTTSGVTAASEAEISLSVVVMAPLLVVL